MFQTRSSSLKIMVTRENKASSSRRNIALFLRIKGRTNANSRSGSKANLYPACTYIHVPHGFRLLHLRQEKTACEHGDENTSAERADKGLIPFSPRYTGAIIVIGILLRSIFCSISFTIARPVRQARWKYGAARRVSPAAFPFPYFSHNLWRG